MKLKSTIFIFFFLYLLNIIFCQNNNDNNNSNEDNNNDSNNENSNNNGNEESNNNDGDKIYDCIENKKKGDLRENIKCCEVNFKINGKGFTLFTPIYDKLSSIKEYKKMLRDAEDVTIDCSEFFLSFYKIMIFLLVFLF